ncbi:MAG: hypothetical protein B6I30_09815 [Desulfobacteraceae bacterium 4572_187]|nr:MAG: hypothetical protein B6I30_09815 [Desulfobacteraceae bacterium 4572_187]
MNYHFENLILLVGTNPLPNLVVADYFLRKNPNIQTIWLVHSERKGSRQAGTTDLADNLETILQNRWKNKISHRIDYNKIPLSDVSDARSIIHDIETNLLKKLKKSGTIHLNYTGGTKSMSTHAYWLLKEMEPREHLSFSYLDARNFRLVGDDCGIIADNLKQIIVMTCDELIELHGFRRRNEEKMGIFDDAVMVFQRLIENQTLDKLFSPPNAGGYDRNLFLNKKDDLAERVGELDKNKINLIQPNETLKSVIASMPEKYQLFDNNGKFRWDISNKNLKTALKCLDGRWLEEYAANSIEDEFCGPAVSIAKNIEIEKPGWSANAKFELDIVLMNGYQPTGISCTTMDRKPGCKSKGFEIIHRTKQIGGDEAKAILITFLNRKTRNLLQDELAYDTGGNQGNVLVMGKDDLRKDLLIQTIRDYIFEN